MLYRCLEVVYAVKGVVAEADIVVIVVGLLWKGVLGAEEGECGGHGRVLVLERELAGVGVRLDHRAGHQPALGRVGLGGLQDDVGLNVLGHRREPLSNRHLFGGGLWHIGNHRELLDPGRKDHLSDAAGAPLALLGVVGVGRCVHRSHGHLQQVGIPFWRLDGGAEELKPSHVCGSLDLDALLAALLDHLCNQLGLVLGRLLLWRRLRLLLRRGRLLLLLAAAGLLLGRCFLLLFRGRLVRLLPLVGLGRRRRLRRCRRGCLQQRRGAEHREELGLCDAGGEPAHHGGKGGEEGRVEDELEGVEQRAGDHHVRQGDALADKEGVPL
mmetsp:Transcript_9744/g.31351  ORF Transcript_9744/g.31351 Transcript_9744/m.31351 type:complete len:326 (+) Transcript_9744:739-1716(+)